MKKIFLVLLVSFSIPGLCFPQEVDSIRDSRDGQVYRVVKIGQQWWLQQNLNTGKRISGSKVAANDGIIEKYCYNNNESLCDVYGGLYTWDEMMDYHPSDNGNPGTVRGICPEGWHIPTDEEWKQLEMYLGMTQAEAGQENIWRGTGVGTKLRAGGNSGYEALYSGRCSSSGTFSLLNEYEYIWTSTDYGYNAWRRCLSIYANNVGRWNTFPKTYAFSVRCVKDICLIENISLDVTKVSCFGYDDGAIDLTVKGTGPFTYQWSTGDTGEDLYGLPAGTYRITVIDSLGCSIDSTFKLNEPDKLNIFANYSPEISAGSGSGYITLDIYGGTEPYSCLWSNGDTGRMLTGLEAGDYRVTITDSHQCTESAGYTIQSKASCPDQQICMVTVDTLTGQNLVVWEKSADKCIDHYHIYREDTLIGTVGYEEMSVFRDSATNPGIQAYKYRISVVDTGDNESCPSSWHKPLFLVISRSAQCINLAWTGYEIDGELMEFESYTLYRGSNMKVLSPLKENLPDNFYHDTDKVALEEKFYYRIAGVLIDPCNPSNTDTEHPEISYTCSFSNIVDNVYCTGCGFTPPTVPEGLQASAEGNTITLTWRSSKDADGVKSYNIYNEHKSLLAAVNDTFHVFNGLSYDTEYFFAVTAVDSLGNESGPSDIISTVTEKLTGFNDIRVEQVSIHPNPFVNMTTIQFPYTEGNRYQLSIFDLAGKIVRSVNDLTVGEIVLNRDGLPAGLYLFEIRGDKIYRGKLVVE